MIEQQYARFTDDLERRLMLAAIDEQFRPQPIKALLRGVRQLIETLRKNSAPMPPIRAY